MTTATGTFEVRLEPQHQDDATGLGRLSIAKTLSGDFDGTSDGEMLTCHGSPKPAAAYVAIERLDGALHGRHGTFALVHKGVMTADEQHASISIVPGSGTGDLAGIEGSMEIHHVDGDHRWELRYVLPDRA